MQELATRLEQKIDRVDNKIDAQGIRLENKIEIAAHDLIIKGAGALVVLASLMIGLKLFG